MTAAHEENCRLSHRKHTRTTPGTAVTRPGHMHFFHNVGIVFWMLFFAKPAPPSLKPSDSNTISKGRFGWFCPPNLSSCFLKHPILLSIFPPILDSPKPGGVRWLTAQGIRLLFQRLPGSIPGPANDIVSLGETLHPTCLGENVVPVLSVSRSG